MSGIDRRAFEASIDARVLAALHADPEQERPWQEFCDAVALSPEDLRASLRRLCLRTTEGPAGGVRS